MKATLTIKVPDDFKKGDCMKCIYADKFFGGCKVKSLIKDLGSLNCPLEIQENNNVLEELKWWREQDLIKRDDVHNMIKDYCRIDDKDCKEKVGCDYCKFLSVQQIPKAEPPHATVDERNGDCETCKHYTDATMYDCPNDCKYEPYIPKEQEQ